MVAEIRPNKKTGRVYCQKISDYTEDTLHPVIETRVDQGVKIFTDKYPGYDKLK
ncbi:transposase, partial [Hydrotalea sp.]|uniref:transposase n=1 Tax=Hydrotalea sp. TaxID=2881279 RepID=UPI00345C32B8